MKVCSKCKKRKPRSRFYARSSSEDRLRSVCKSCVLAWQDGRKSTKTEYDRQRYQANREAMKARVIANYDPVKKAAYTIRNKDRIAGSVLI